jgi:hypothetical protein
MTRFRYYRDATAESVLSGEARTDSPSDFTKHSEVWVTIYRMHPLSDLALWHVNLWTSYFALLAQFIGVLKSGYGHAESFSR